MSGTTQWGRPPGLPRISDGALLFLLHMISKMQEPPESYTLGPIKGIKGGEGSRIAIVFNGSPLFTGDAGSGESNIRRYIIEKDMLDTVIGLPDQMFYNTCKSKCSTGHVIQIPDTYN